jgi:hypothetical protein
MSLSTCAKSLLEIGFKGMSGASLLCTRIENTAASSGRSERDKRPDDGPFAEIQGGLLVMDLSTKTIIQRVPEVRIYAHIEYDAGYLITTGRGELSSVPLVL